jgi:prepilin-type N-terminal cleavage/methylation domain-containing protein
MTPTRRPTRRSSAGQRGVTLIEMLVTVAVLVIIMTIMVQIFSAATGAVTAAQAIQGLDDRLKLLDSTIRSDLGGVTARFTPPLNPAAGLGYFEYGENEFADSQGEDGDDYIRFTAKAPAGQPFTGRMWVYQPAVVNNTATGMTNLTVQPVTVSSEYAEIIYFLRNGNLYRRVLLCSGGAAGAKSGLQSTVTQAINNVFSLSGSLVVANGAQPNPSPFFPPPLGGNPVTQKGQNVSWQAVNDVSARPNPLGNATVDSSQVILVNTLGDLTNRENRPFYSRFSSDFAGLNGGPDGIPDDLNSDNIWDLYPSLYPNVFNAGPANPLNTGLVYASNYQANATAVSLMAFPFTFPGAYSKAQKLPNATDAAGWIHSPAPVANYGGNEITFDVGLGTAGTATPLNYVQSINHNPLDLGDNLPTPINPVTPNATDFNQTWWGFPTWRETLSPFWNDPTFQINVNLAQPNGLASLTPAEVSNGSVTATRALLPCMTNLAPAVANGPPILWRNVPQLFCDNAGDPNQNGANFFVAAASALWGILSWEDDLIMTNVRSFDVKAYDNSLGAYADLGWGDDPRVTGVNATPLLVGNVNILGGTNPPQYPVAFPNILPGQIFDLIGQTFAHEGRMPPLVNDNRLDFQYPNLTYVNSATFNSQYFVITATNAAGNTDTFNFKAYSSNVGDNTAGIVRLRRVWETWSTEYSQAPANGVYHNPTPPTGGDPLEGFPWGPNGGTPPIYPSYPPPYPAPLRGIQIQIRVADPSNQRLKSVTIRQDFTDRL